MARVPEEVDGPVPGEVLADGTERRLRLLPEGSDVEGEDLVEAPIAEVGLLQRDGLEHSPARVDVLAVPPRCHLDHLGRAVDRGDRSRRQPLAEQGDRDAVAAADLEQAVGRADLQSVDRPDEPLRWLARHARAIASRAREAQAVYSMNVSVDGFIADREGASGWSAGSEELFREPPADRLRRACRARL